jgi:hypothetical protein
VAETDLVAGPSFWTIEELAARCGHYCWLERRLFEVTGRRASAPTSGEPTAAEAEIRLCLSVLSARHAALAEAWHERLPVRAGVDRAALIAPPPGPFPEALDVLGAAADLAGVLGGLVEQVLPRLVDSYDRHLDRASAVGEGPVRAVLERAGLDGGREIEQGRALLQRVTDNPAEAENVAEFSAQLQHLLEGATGVFPSARAS